MNHLTWDDAAALMSKLRPGRTVLLKADGTRWSVRTAVFDEDRIVVRRWYSRMRRHYYEVVDDTALVVGLFKVVKL